MKAIKLIDKLDEGYDVVYGSPNHEQHGILRVLASQVTKLALQNIMGAETARSVSSFRSFVRKVRDAVYSNFHGPFVSIDVLFLTWGTKRFAAIPVRHNLRQSGLSNYTFRMLLIHSLNMMTGFSILPSSISQF